MVSLGTISSGGDSRGAWGGLHPFPQKLITACHMVIRELSGLQIVERIRQQSVKHSGTMMPGEKNKS